MENSEKNDGKEIGETAFPEIVGSTFSFKWESKTGNSIHLGGKITFDKNQKAWRAVLDNGLAEALNADPAFAATMAIQAWMGVPYPSNGEVSNADQ